MMQPGAASPPGPWPAAPAPLRFGAALRGALFCAALAVLAWAGQAVLLHPVRIVDGDEGVVAGRVLRGNVADALRQLGVQLREGDRTEPALGVEVHPGMTIRVQRAFDVIVTVDGQHVETLAVGGTVGELLRERAIRLGPLDEVTPALDQPVTPGTAVRVVRVQEVTRTRREPIPFKTLRWAEPRWEKGKTGILREGREGVVEYTERLRYEDGKLVSTTVVGTRRIQEPVAQIIGVGTRIVWRTLRTPAGVIRYREALPMIATAYYPGPESTGRSADGVTATGMRAGLGVVAVDPRVIPLGTRLYIPGYGLAVAGDVGGAIKGRRIDLGFNTLREALHFGRRPVTVYVLD
ncbi:3D domain-containing protein [Carboxydochorda subterranea]|uniref:3D domain-containing protein n=1 Tax=Carboxydichorda subterranea TaxID=3109565 RepID=A0ABZ1BWB5_9FIRM|nr:3D domain-containing protein [Limnochorda sp. L945t]WRP17072.1 3D domain-containing protein [Limnochorda sp. L945t]